MNKLSKSLVFGLFISLFIGVAATALAQTPILSASYQGGSSSSVQIGVSYANSYSSVNLYSRQTSSLWTTVNNIGQTDQSGNFTDVISMPGDGSSNPIQMYVTVGGLQSSTVSVYANGSGYSTGGCTYYGCSNYNVGGLTLSQTSLSLSVGQSSSVTATSPVYGYNNSVYVSSNSNSGVASASASGNQITVYGLASGSTNISICSSGSSTCATLYVTVGGTSYNNSGTITFSPSTVNLSVGQSSSVFVNAASLGTSLYVSSNSNSSVVTASITGSTLYLQAGSSGSSTITVCQYSYSSCGYLYVTVGGSGNNGGLSLTQTSLSLSVGQTSSVSAYNNYSSSLYISSNSNSSVASASVSGSQINIYGLTSGNTTISVCSGNGGCATLYVTVSGSGCNYYNCGVGNLSLSQSSLSMSVGQRSTVTVSGNSGTSFYISTNSNSSVVSASISGSQISIYALASGSSSISICQNGYSSACVSLYVTVTGGSYSGSIYFSPSSLSLGAGQSSTVTVYNNNNSYGSYYLSSNSNSAVASASISGSSLYVSALTSGSTSVVVCQSSYGSSCATLYVTVTGVLGANTNLWFSPANPTLYVGQSLAVSVNSSAYANSYPYSSSAYYVSSNSNPSVVSASISGTVLNLYGNQNGSSNISVCSSALGYCSTLYVTVGGGSSYYGGTLSLSQTSVSLSQGQSATVSAYNVPSVYVSSNSNPSAVSVSTSVNQITFYGIGSGNSAVILCGANSSQCATVYATVNGYATSNIVLSQTSLGLSVGQTATVNISGNGGYGYYLAQNSNPGVVSASFNGSVLSVYGLANGNSTLQICQNSAPTCPTLYVTVGAGYYSYSGGNGSTGGLQYEGGGSGVLGASTYLNGELISEGSTVYIVYQNTKSAFSSAYAFTGLGFKFSNVVAVGNSGLPDSGYVVTTPYAAHPWGSWIKSGSTVYFVHQSGLIPVPDWNTFLNNGGQAVLIVPANSYDFKLPILSAMTSGDSRLQ